jgi:hypothetical protein
MQCFKDREGNFAVFNLTKKENGMPPSEFVQLLRNGERSRAYTEIAFQAVDFLLELKQKKYRYDEDQESRQYHDCMTLVVSELLVGPDIETLSTFTGISFHSSCLRADAFGRSMEGRGGRD